ncbi:DNA cytosine methyltransferase [Phascolarctobacterium faecium]|uniref:DNA cytosine methyltransferase n=1 Tax=Phascolarctobacterium faecium TaxID=33025 RepID=UPI003AB2860E
MQLINNNDSVNRYLLPEPLYKLLNTLSKHYSNEKRLNSFLQKQTKFLIKNIKSYVSTVQDIHDEYHTMITSKLMELTESFNPDTIINIKNDVSNIVSLQKALLSVEEIHQNKLIGKYNYIDGTISFITKSFSVIDYINAILGNDYIQCGGTLNAKWFGVPQYRRRHVIVGIRRDKYKGGPLLPQKAENVPIYSVWDAIKDLATYESSYDIARNLV